MGFGDRLKKWLAKDERMIDEAITKAIETTTAEWEKNHTCNHNNISDCHAAGCFGTRS